MLVPLRIRTWLSLPLACAGCTELVVVGRECDQTRELCVELLDSGGPVTGSIDAGIADLDTGVATHDAGVLVDSAVDGASPADAAPPPSDAARVFPKIVNPSFELTDGMPGDVAALSLPTGTSIAPWYSCQAIGVGGQPGLITGVRAEQSVQEAADAGVGASIKPRDGEIFISMQYFALLLAPSLVQQLGEPLMPGVRYGFAIDVRTSRPSASLSLQVFGTNAGCDTGNSTLLAQTDPIREEGWQTVCLPFTAAGEFTSIRLAESAGSPVSGDRLYFDRLRPMADCP